MGNGSKGRTSKRVKAHPAFQHDCRYCGARAGSVCKTSGDIPAWQQIDGGYWPFHSERIRSARIVALRDTPAFQTASDFSRDVCITCNGPVPRGRARCLLCALVCVSCKGPVPPGTRCFRCFNADL